MYYFWHELFIFFFTCLITITQSDKKKRKCLHKQSLFFVNILLLYIDIFTILLIFSTLYEFKIINKQYNV